MYYTKMLHTGNQHYTIIRDKNIKNLYVKFSKIKYMQKL